MNQLRSWVYGRDKSVLNNQDGQENQLLTEVSKVKSDESSKFVLNVIPLVPGDCLSCKIIGTLTMAGSGIFVIGSAAAARDRNRMLKGPKGPLYFSLCAFLFIGFETAAVCRLMDWGPFKKS